MARPEKHTVDYFPFYVKDGRTLFILESKYGCKGTGFFTNVLRFLCDSPDHHYCIKDESDRLFFFSKTHCDEESGIDMLGIMAKTGKLLAHWWVSGMVIYSPSLMESLKDAYRSRRNMLLTQDQIMVIYDINPPIAALSTLETLPNDGVNQPDNPQKKRKEKKRKNPLTPLAEIQQAFFDRFWKSYPKKKSKGQAEKAWLLINPDEQLLTTMIATIGRAKKSDDWYKDSGKYIPHPATWLNAKGWEDETGVDLGRRDQKQDQKTPFVACQRCGEEYLKTDIIDVKGSIYCPKCPEARTSFTEGSDHLKDLLRVIG